MNYFPEVIDLPGSSFGVAKAACSGKRRGFVILLPELWGIVPQILALAGRYAAEGFETWVPDIIPGTLEPTHDREAMLARYNSVDEARGVRQIAEVTRIVRAKDPTVPVVLAGYCFGGRMALNAAARVKVDGVIVYYGSFRPRPEAVSFDVLRSAADIEVPVQGHYGIEDAGIPQDEVQRLEQVLRRGRVFVYEGAGHAFANETREMYRPEAAQLAWTRTLEFLGETELNYKLFYRKPVTEVWELPENA